MCKAFRIVPGIQKVLYKCQLLLILVLVLISGQSLRGSTIGMINSVFSPPVIQFNSQIPRTEYDMLASILGPPLDLD